MKIKNEMKIQNVKIDIASSQQRKIWFFDTKAINSMQSGLFKIYFIIKKDLNFITDKKIKEKKNNLSKNRFASTNCFYKFFIFMVISKFNGITC